jgi:hypothetical protein
LTDPDPAVFNVGALTRASQTVLSVRPWNAFANAAPAVDATPEVQLPSPAPRPPTVTGRVPGLNRRVPGATLSSLEKSAPRPASSHPQQTGLVGQPSGNADEVRDSLAGFEDGVARAMREVNRPPEEGL